MGVGPSRLSESIALYLGSIRDATDKKKLSGAEITHLVSILSNKQISQMRKSTSDKFTEPLFEDRSQRKRLLIAEDDHKNSNLSKHFEETSEFIHRGLWIDHGNLLIHCMMGKSRSATISTAYLCTITGLPWLTVLNSLRFCREVVDPNEGFKEQLRLYEENGLFERDSHKLGQIHTIDQEILDKLKKEIVNNAENYLQKTRRQNARNKEIETVLYTK
ncbi:Oidioi.mRNA.OKI2018_I69.chr2.g5718.t1.cds [Oikopleura dioica]|uniref:Oidioi.mRNA.OKI2018_I69.chr2.g5718.t1.cds n=1 Tax=Oikopleura dioica TaxID=34765 RepID=A0ABN7T6U1_OIKDI|nr:Oidioi.mRNA.OKI2018_I69.chr2.g5718.t1.cds [Oikopleura dioica]